MRGGAAAPDVAAFRAVARADAGLFTHRVNYPVAARLARLAFARDVRPTALTLGNLLLGVGASVGVIVAGPHVVVGVLAWLCWQFAYCLDCADGQLARVAGSASAAGGRLDVLCDIAVQVALVSAVIAVSTGYPAWLPGVFAAGWMVNMVTSVMAKEGTNVSLIRSRSLPVRLAKVVRDYGFVVTVIAAVLVFSPPAMVWVMWWYAVANAGFLLASIVHMGVVSWCPARPPGPGGTPPVSGSGTTP